MLSLDKNIVPQQSGPITQLLDRFLFSPTRFGVQLFAFFACAASSTGNVSGPGDSGRYAIRDCGNPHRLASLFLSARVFQNQIAGIKTYDPVTLISVVAILLLAGYGASYVPSRRATLVDPLISLRYELSLSCLANFRDFAAFQSSMYAFRIGPSRM